MSPWNIEQGLRSRGARTSQQRLDYGHSVENMPPGNIVGQTERRHRRPGGAAVYRV